VAVIAHSHDEVIDNVSEWVQWWVGQRRAKLTQLRHETHAVNPFLWPITFGMHGFSSMEQMAEFQLAGHLVEGHATGFGKLVDEKILPNVFGTQKLDKAYRENTPPLIQSQFDNIDHLVPTAKGAVDLLSLKAGRWSIQLGQAVQLNRSLQVLLRERDRGGFQFDRIVIGVFYGTEATLTDKYAIIRGLATRAVHDVVDISEHVDVLAGRSFWAWLNGGELATQEWVLDGIFAGMEADKQANGDLADLYRAFIRDYEATYSPYMTSGDMNWRQLLGDVNG
jgi:hypothetical protein